MSGQRSRRPESGRIDSPLAAEGSARMSAEGSSKRPQKTGASFKIRMPRNPFQSLTQESRITALSLCRVSLVVAALCSLSVLPVAIHGQAADEPSAGTPGDWSHHRVLFATPGTADDARKKGKLERWTRITNDRRYKLQQWKRTRRRSAKKSTKGKDWSMDIGTALSLLPNQ